VKRAAIVGATGFGGLGLIDILSRHPEIEIASLSALDHGKEISSMFPHIEGICSLEVLPPEQAGTEGIDIAFLSTPDQAGMKIAKKYYDRNIPVIDFSGDFRFSSTSEYSVYAGNKGMSDNHDSPDLLNHSVYGLPEKYHDRIAGAAIIGNPGCFAMSMILGLLPAVESGIINPGTVICDGKTGVSGAGINPGAANTYPARYDNTNTYKEGRHQHLVEVETILNRFAGSGEYKIMFVPQIVPMNRGILTTIYCDPASPCDTKKLIELYSEYYCKSPFIHVTDKSPSTASVRGTNRCLIYPCLDSRTGKILIVSVIDNLMKGQSGNAVQNANIRLGLDQQTGLNLNPFYP